MVRGRLHFPRCHSYHCGEKVPSSYFCLLDLNSRSWLNLADTFYSFYRIYDFLSFITNFMLKQQNTEQEWKRGFTKILGIVQGVRTSSVTRSLCKYGCYAFGLNVGACILFITAPNSSKKRYCVMGIFFIYLK